MATAPGELLCSKCKSQCAEVVCTECDINTCKPCVQSHLKQPGFSDHTIKNMAMPLQKTLFCFMCNKDDIGFICEQCENGYLCHRCLPFHKNIPTCSNHIVHKVSVNCLMCKGTNTLYTCKQCPGALCQACYSRHKNIPECRDHEVELLEGELSENADDTTQHLNQSLNESTETFSSALGSGMDLTGIGYSTKYQTASVGEVVKSRHFMQTSTPILSRSDSQYSYMDRNDLSIKDFKAWDSTLSSVMLSWEENYDADEYLISMSGKEEPWSVDACDNQLTISELAPGEKYNFKIHALRDNRKGPGANVNVATKAISKVKEFEITESTFTSMTLSWEEVTEADEYGIMMNDWDKPRHVEYGLNRFTVGNLDPGQQVRFSIWAIKKEQNGPKAHMHGTTKEIPKIRNVRDKLTTFSSTTLSWDKDTSVDSYMITLVGRGNPWHINMDKTEQKISDLAPDQDYNFEICALKSQHHGKITTHTVTTKNLPQIKDFSTFETTFTSVVLSWEEVFGVDEYQLTVIGKDQQLYLESGTNRYTIDDLKPGKQYRFRISAVKESKRGPVSHISATTLEIPGVKNFSAKTTFSSVSLFWSVVPLIDEYYLRMLDTARSWHLEQSRNQYEVTDLSPSEECRFEICAIKGQEEGQKSHITISVKEIPKIQDFNVMDTTFSSITIAWDEVHSIDEYEITLAGTDQVWNIDGRIVQHVIEDLAPRKQYRLSICAVKKNKKGPRAYLYPSTKDMPKVKDFTVLEASCSMMKLSWRMIPGIDHYEIRQSGKKISWTTERGHTQYLVSDLNPGKQYAFSIAALKAEETGPSSSTEASTKELSQVKNFRVTKVDFSSVVLAWDKEFDGCIYKITMIGDECWSLDDKSEFAITDLVPATKYKFQIFAACRSENGPSNYVETSTTDVPKIEDIITIEQSLVFITLSWNEPYEEANLMEITVDGNGQRLAKVSDGKCSIKNLSPDDSHTLTISSIKEGNQRNQPRDLKIDPKDLPMKGEPVSLIRVIWKDIEGVDKYEIAVIGKKKKWHVEKNMYTILNHTPGTDFTVTVTAIKSDVKGETVMITSKAESMAEYRRSRFHELLQMYGLQKLFPNKITLQDLLIIDKEVVNESAPCSLEDLYRYVFHKAMMLNYKARSAQIIRKSAVLHPEDESNNASNILEFLQASEEPSNTNVFEQPHPIDLILCMFHCSDMFAQQYFVTKLSQCQLSLPFLIIDPQTFEPCLPLWSFRMIQKGWCTKEENSSDTYKDQHIVSAESKVISFIRFGNFETFSKSELVNSILNRTHEIFFHRNSKGSKKDRILIDGTVEIAWYLSSGKKDDTFSELVAFVNLRGDAREYEIQTKFLCEISAGVVIFLSKDELKLPAVKEKVEEITSSNNSVMCVIVDGNMPMEKNNNTWRYGIVEENKADITEEIQHKLQEIVKNAPKSMSLSLEDCVRIAKSYNIHCDEETRNCREARQLADNIMKQIDTIEPFSSVKKKILPLQGDEWHEWSDTQKKITRPELKENESITDYDEKLKNKLEQLRHNQGKVGLPPNNVIRDVISHLSHKNVKMSRFFLHWIKFSLDSLSGQSLEVLNSKYNTLWNETNMKKKRLQDDMKRNKIQKQEQDKLEKEIKGHTKKLNELNEEIFASSLGTEHLLRELSQMYECAKETNFQPDVLMPDVFSAGSLPHIAVNLLLQGQAIELMDGDAGHVPCQWISAVLTLLSQNLSSNKTENCVFVLTVLGIQSTGKSTLLNAMFGLQFSVSAGRCTRGAYMQLLKVSEDMCQILGYEYILIVDTEGLRAPELSNTDTQTRDNELATFVIGLGDITLINIFGENPSDMNDVLQIVVQAFLRMKKVNIKPRCYFVHQNVGAVDAKEKLNAGKRIMMDKLDDMTRIAAEQEGSSEQYFSEVINFSEQKNISYLSSLWQGDPPMAPPNPGYSEKIHSLKCSLLNLPREEEITCLPIRFLKDRILDLWNALLSENFVFNFKNTLEIYVYREVEQNYNNWRWTMHNFAEEEQDKAVNKIDNAVGDRVFFEKAKIHLQDAICKHHDDIMKEVERYFETNNQKNVSIQWKGKILRELGNTKKELIESANSHCSEFFNTQLAHSKINQSIAHCENIFLCKAQELSQEVKLDGGQDEIDVFNGAWDTWVREISSSLNRTHVEQIDMYFEAEKFLLKMYRESFNQIRKKLLSKGLKNIQKFILIKEDHITLKRTLKFWKTVNDIQDTDVKKAHQIATTIEENAEEHLKHLTTMGVNRYKPSPKSYFTKANQRLIESIESCQHGLQNIKLTQCFVLDMAIVIISKTAKVLENLHSEYCRKHDPLLILEDKKEDILYTFKSYVAGASDGIIAADIFIRELTSAVWKYFVKTAYTVLQYEAKSNMAAISGNRCNLDLHIKRHLVEKENFQDYMKYVTTPKDFVEYFIYKHMKHESCSRNEAVKVYIQKALTIKIKDLFTKCQHAHDKAARDSGIDAITYVEAFQKELSESIPLGQVVTAFRGLTIAQSDASFFFKQVEKRLPEIQSLEGKLKELFEDFSKFDPILTAAADSISNFFTNHGCWEKCPFCSEVCINTLKDHDSDHSVVFHKPQGISGWYYRGTDRLVIEQCSSFMKTDKSFYASKDRLFKYKNYRDAGSPYDSWNIVSDDSMKKHWQWFTARFERALHAHHGKYMKNIPESWKKLEKLEVLEELKNA